MGHIGPRTIDLIEENRKEKRKEEADVPSKGKSTGKQEKVSQTSFGHISINSSSILTVSMATESP